MTHSTWSSHNSYSRQRVLLVGQPVSEVVGLIKPLRGSLLVVNFKTYLEATGKRAIDLAKSAEKAARESGVSVIVVPQFTDIKPVSENVDITVFSQHLDPVKPGAYTGRILAEAVKSAGAEGSLLNHSERRIGTVEINSCVERCEEADLYSLVGISVSKARPELITYSLQKIRTVNSTVKVLCGAGITTSEDVSKAIELGTEGVLVASSVVKSKNPDSVLSDMANAIANAK